MFKVALVKQALVYPLLNNELPQWLYKQQAQTEAHPRTLVNLSHGR